MNTIVTEEIKERLVKEYIPLVKYIASRVTLGKSKYIEYEDLISYGMVGLVDAINKFDEGKGVKFSTYASLRIKGSMIDQLRKERPISKGAMDKLHKYNDAMETLQRQNDREPTNEEIAKYMGVNKEAVYEIEGYINYMSIMSLEEVVFSDDEDMTRMGLIEDKNSPSPESSLEDQESIRLLTQGIERLKDKDRTVLNLYYYEGLTLKEIGQVLEVSESRVCQLHSRAIKKLREELKKLDF
ncbi:MAG: FliA/WhiG family RNA polymerase sigma factor [Clostridium sp.]